MNMADVFDVAKYILVQMGEMTSMKLQKLVYYSQAWSLVWDNKPLFDSQIQAWANGPVVPDLYNQHKGMFIVNKSTFKNGNPKNLSDVEIETIDAVLSLYGKKSAPWLSELTHNEAPWKNARYGLRPGEMGSREIKQSEMYEYYESLI